MKNIIKLSIAVFFILLISAPVYASSYKVTSKAVKKSEEIEISGQYPIVNLADKNIVEMNLQDSINSLINDIVDEKINNAISSRARGLSISYKVKSVDDIVSIIIYSTVVSGTSKEDVNSVNFDLSSYKIISINDVLGPNAVKLANQHINDVIKSDTDKYNNVFNGITDSQDFYVTDTELVLLFDTYEIAKGYAGTQEIAIDKSRIVNYQLSPDKLGKSDSNLLRLIPLREVCEQFGYEVRWNSHDKPISISSGDNKLSVTVRENKYYKGSNPVTLESAPVLMDGTTYVPITFFESILSLTCFVDSDNTVTFSKLNDQ